jgi:acyl carrier protein
VIPGTSIDRVAAVFASVIGMPAPAAGVDLLETAMLDSLALIELIHALEVEFTTELPLEEMEIEHFRTLDTIAKLVVEGSATDSPDVP